MVISIEMRCSSLAAGQPHPGQRAALLQGGWNKNTQMLTGGPATCCWKTTHEQERALHCLRLLQSVGTYIKNLTRVSRDLAPPSDAL